MTYRNDGTQNSKQFLSLVGEKSTQNQKLHLNQTTINNKLKKTLIGGHLPDQKRWRRNKEKLNKKEQDLMEFWTFESRFHYLCPKV